MSYRFSSKFLRKAAEPVSGHGFEPSKAINTTLFIFAAAGFYALFHMQSVAISYDSAPLVRQKEKLIYENRILELKLEAMSSGKGIEKIAREKYGFVSPSASRIYVIKKEKNLLKRLFASSSGGRR